MRRLLFLLIGLMFVGSVHGQTLVQEDFSNTNFSARGWYDGNFAIDANSGSPAGGPSYRGDFAAGNRNISGSNGMRIQFTPIDSMKVAYWVKYSANWIGSGQPYHPHEFVMVTDADGMWVGPGNTRLTAYIEHNYQNGRGVPKLALQDGVNVDAGNIGNDLTGITENRSAHGCNGPNTFTAPTIGTRQPVPDCYIAGGSYFNNIYWSTSAPNINVTDGQWHYLEANYFMNSIQNGIGQYDGYLSLAMDGEIISEQSNILLRTGQNATMKFNQLMLLPFIGDGSPVNQTMWIDGLVISDASMLAPPDTTIPPPPDSTRAPLDNIAHWYTPNPPIEFNTVTDKDLHPVAVPKCDTVAMHYTYTRPFTFFTVDTIKGMLASTNTRGCTLFLPRTEVTAAWFKKLKPFPGVPVTIPGSPVVNITEIP